MSKIIVATDFSAAAKNASEYALHLADYFNASLKLVHSFDVPFTFSDIGMQYIDIHELERNTEEALQEEISRLTAIKNHIQVTYRSCVGRIHDCLNDIINREEPILIVFGMSGENDNFLWGSTAVTALRFYKVPVLIIPKTASWQGIQNICYAVNYKKLHNNTPYHSVKNWAKKFTGKLTVFNVHQVGQYKEPPSVLKDALKGIETNYVSQESDNFQIGIQDFLTKNNFDCLIIVPQKHGFFDRIMNTSRAEQITKVSSVPILSFYES